MSKNLLIRNVPDEVATRLAEKAAGRGQSLQVYLLDLVTQHAGQLTMPEWMARVEGHKRGRPAGSMPIEQYLQWKEEDQK